MSKGRVIAVVVAVLMVLGLMLLFAKEEKAKSHSWAETYDVDGKEPYDTYIIGKMLDDAYPKHNFKAINKGVHIVLGKKQHGNYIAIGRELYYNEEDIDSLLSFVESGNKAFLATLKMPSELLLKIAKNKNLGSFYEREYPMIYNDAPIKLLLESFPQDSLMLYKKWEAAVVPSTWNALPESYSNLFFAQNLGYTSTGKNDSLYFNMCKITYGSGEIYLHCLPLAFTNFYQITPAGKEYAASVFSHLSNDDIYYDNVSQSSFGQENNKGESPLSYILKQKSLRWAWYLLLALILLFILFRAKRKQKIIPVIEPNSNTSIMFIETIGKLYYLQNNHRKIALYKMKHFEFFVRRKYQINIAKGEQHQLNLLANASGIDISKINNIDKQHKHISALDNITKEQLMEFYLAIQEFYKNCK